MYTYPLVSSYRWKPWGFWDSAKEFSCWQTDFSEFLWFSKDVTSVKIPVDRPQPCGLRSEQQIQCKFYMRGWVVIVQCGCLSSTIPQVIALFRPTAPCHSVWAVLDADMAPKSSCESPGHHGFQELSHGLETINEFGGTPMDWKAPSYNALTSPTHSALSKFSAFIAAQVCLFFYLDTSFQSLIPKRGVTNFKWDRDILRPEMWAASTCPSCQGHRQQKIKTAIHQFGMGQCKFLSLVIRPIHLSFLDHFGATNDWFFPSTAASHSLQVIQSRTHRPAWTFHQAAPSQTVAEWCQLTQNTDSQDASSEAITVLRGISPWWSWLS